MRFISILLLSCLLCIGNFLSAQTCEKLVWSDEFDGTALDLSKWSYDIGNGCPDLCGWGNQELQYYSDDSANVSVSNGVLRITAKEDTLGGFQYSSGKIITRQKAAFRYGRIEASCKMPTTKGMWPAFWLLPTENVYGEWPRSGEIDILEILGNRPDRLLGTVHTGLPWTFVTGVYELPAPETFADDFHVFGIEWNEDTIRWFVDGIQYHEVTSDSLSPWLPFQEDFYLILNVAVGGTLPGNPDSTTVLPQSMEVDWVRVYNSPDQMSVSGRQPTIAASGSTYRTFDIPGASYVWTVPTGASITSGLGTNEITVDWGCTAGDVQLELLTDCDSVTLSYEVANFREFEIRGEEEVGANTPSLAFSVPELVGGTYTWSVPADANIMSGQGTSEIVVDWGCTSGEVYLSGMSTCGAIADTFTVNLETYLLSGPSTVPLNGTNRSYSIPEIIGATYSWSVPSDAVIVSGQGTRQITVDFGTQAGQVSVEVTNACGTQTYLTDIIIDPSIVYCDFEGTDIGWGAFSGAFFERIENPVSGGINTSPFVGRTRKDPGAQPWGGIFADLGFEMDLVNNPLLNVKVYGEKGGQILLKLEDQDPGTTSPVEIGVDYDSASGWTNLVWDFSEAETEAYDRIALFFNFGSTDTADWYFDDVIGEPAQGTNISASALQPVEVYPNPASDQVEIRLNGNFTGYQKLDLQLLDMQGRVIHEETKSVADDKVQLPLPEVSPGTYLLRISSSKMHYVKALIIRTQ